MFALTRPSADRRHRRRGRGRPPARAPRRGPARGRGAAPARRRRPLAAGAGHGVDGVSRMAPHANDIPPKKFADAIAGQRQALCPTASGVRAAHEYATAWRTVGLAAPVGASTATSRCGGSGRAGRGVPAHHILRDSAGTPPRAGLPAWKTSPPRLTRRHSSPAARRQPRRRVRRDDASEIDRARVHAIPTPLIQAPQTATRRSPRDADIPLLLRSSQAAPSAYCAAGVIPSSHKLRSVARQQGAVSGQTGEISRTGNAPPRVSWREISKPRRVEPFGRHLEQCGLADGHSDQSNRVASSPQPGRGAAFLRHFAGPWAGEMDGIRGAAVMRRCGG